MKQQPSPHPHCPPPSPPCLILGDGGLDFPYIKILLLFESACAFQIELERASVVLRRGKIGTPAKKLLKAMTKNTNKLKTHGVDVRT